MWKTPAINRLIQEAFREDSARHDLTSQALIPPSWRLEAAIRSKQKGIPAGLPLAGRIFKAMDSSCRVQFKARDGHLVKPGDVLFLIKGRARSILAAERPALNALQHLSGIATYTYDQVQKLKGSKTRLLDTRKTLPGWRALQKYAVTCGGGMNHRQSLGDAILVKENHLRICRAGGFDWVKTLKRLSGNPIQIEIQTAQDLADVLRVKPSRVLLDNLSPNTLKAMIQTLRRELPHTEIEISGGVKPEDLKRLSRLGVEYISMGRLTHSAPSFDCSLDILRVHTA